MTSGFRAWARWRAKRALLGLVSRATGRHAVLLPREAREDDALLSLSAPYRVDGPSLAVQFAEPASGRLTAELLGYNGRLPTRTIWTGPAREYGGPCELRLDLGTGSVRLDGREWGRVALPLPGRRFCWRFTLTGPDGLRRRRLSSHYLPGQATVVDEHYYRGGTYVDHEAESAGDHGEIVALLQRHHARGPTLEVGCATGGLLAELEAAGLSAVGLDVSAWAVARATERLGAGRAWVCDVEKEEIPAEIVARGPFGALVLAAVFEHFRHPFCVLGNLAGITAPGTVLVITTVNADGLGQTLFGPEWEGHFDWTHYGVDRVGVKSLREELPRLGWRIAELRTDRVWDLSADPTRATLREWWAADGRFRRLLAERDLGDLITCVAVKA